MVSEGRRSGQLRRSPGCPPTPCCKATRQLLRQPRRLRPCQTPKPSPDEWLGWGDFNNKFKLRVSLGYYPETSRAARCREQSRRYPRPLGGAAARNGLVFLRFCLRTSSTPRTPISRDRALRFDTTILSSAPVALCIKPFGRRARPWSPNSPSVNVATFPAPPPALTAQAPANTPARNENEQGDRYFYGRGVEQDYAKAMEWYLERPPIRDSQTHNTILERSTKKRLGCHEGYRPSESLVIRRPPITVTPSRRPPCSGCSPSKIHQGKPHRPPSLHPKRADHGAGAV